MFSSRVPGDLGPNTVAAAVERMRLSGRGFDDLTVSNPTDADIEYPAGLLAGLADPKGAAVRPAAVRPGCRPRSRVGPSPHIAACACHRATSCSRPAAVKATRCFSSCCAIPANRCWCRPRAIRCLNTSPTGLRSRAAVSRRISRHLDDRPRRPPLRDRRDDQGDPRGRPNNPTGGWLKRDELFALVELCAAHHLALIGDEVFADYPIDPAPGAVRSVLDQGDVLTVSLGGLSKSVGLPQLKLGWMALRGPSALLQSALMRLEIACGHLLIGRHAGAVRRPVAARGRAWRQAPDSPAPADQLPPTAEPLCPTTLRVRRCAPKAAGPPSCASRTRCPRTSA